MNDVISSHITLILSFVLLDREHRKIDYEILEIFLYTSELQVDIYICFDMSLQQEI